MDCERVGIAGLGLIGVSIAQGLAAGFAREVVGYDPDPRARTDADSSVSSTTERLDDLQDSGLIVLASPPGVIPELAQQIARWPVRPACVTDVASVKTSVAQAIPTTLRPRFVPGHPMAGHESTGSNAARADIFHGAHWILCPLEETEQDCLQTVLSMVRHLRALPIQMRPEEHDRHVAVFSHLPHVLANSLLLMSEGLEHRNAHGGSWRDMTRVGGANPALWADILVTNKGAVLNQLDTTNVILSEFRSAIESDDKNKIAALIERGGAL